MYSHREHPDGGDPKDAVLFDDCIRCAEHAALITTIDGETLVTLLAREPLTETEADAIQTINKAATITSYAMQAWQRSRMGGDRE